MNELIPSFPMPEPTWLQQARRRNAPYAAIADNDFSPAVLDRRALLKAYDEATARATKAESRADGLQAELAEQEAAALQWAKTLAEYSNEISRLRTASVVWLAVAEREPFAFVPYLVAVKQDEGLNKGQTTTINRTCCWDSVEKVWVRHGVSPRSILTREVTHYAEIPAFAAPTPPPSSPAAAGPGEPGWFSPLAFDSVAEYDASAARNIERIESGEIQPREPDEDVSAGRCQECGCPLDAGEVLLICESCYENYPLFGDGVSDSADTAAAPTTTGQETPPAAAKAEQAMCEVYLNQSDVNYTPEEMRISARSAAATAATGEGKGAQNG